MPAAEKSHASIVGSSRAAGNFLARYFAVAVVVDIAVVDYVAPVRYFPYPRRDHVAESQSVPSAVIPAFSLAVD